MHATLQDFLHTLDREGELVRVTAPISPLLEATAIADRLSRDPCARESLTARTFDPLHHDRGGRAVLFENVDGCDFPLAMNVFGSYRRMEMALGCAETGGFEQIAARIASLTQPQPPRSMREALGKAREFAPLLRIGPKRKRRGRCQEVVRHAARGEVDLLRLPIIKCWPLDGDPMAVGYPMSAEEAGTAGGHGRYITLAGMHTIHADDALAEKPASHNIGMYRAQLLGPTKLAMHWHMHHDGAAHWRSWKRAGRPMPIAIAFGGESVLPYAATAPLPPGLSELLMAGFLNGRGIPLVPCRTVPLRVPANSEIVIEGYVNTDCGPIDWDPRQGEPLGPGAVFEGPFGDHTGFYSMPDRYPIVDVTAMTHRRDAVFPATIVGLPPQEDYYLGKATERVFLPLLKILIPDIDDYHLPQFGCFHNCAFVRINKHYPLQARRVMHAIWGAGQMAWTKMIVVVDADVDVHDEVAVLRAIFERCDFERDVEIVNGPLDILDHAAPRLGAGHKFGFDATRAWPGEEVAGVPIERPHRAEVTPEALKDYVRAIDGTHGIVATHLPGFGLSRCLFLGVDKTQPGQGRAAIEAAWTDEHGCAPDFVVAVDASVNVRAPNDVLFHLCANADPGRDLVRRGARFGVDATSKMPGDEHNGQPVRPYPPILTMDDAVTKRVDDRWSEYGF